MSDVPHAVFLNGPGANLYGLDPSGTYGRDSFPAIRDRCLATAQAAGLTLDFKQSNDEGELINWIQAARTGADGVLINAAGLSYTSVAIMDALLAFDGPVIEVHMSNIHKREPFRHRTYTSQGATGSVSGLGVIGYELAVQAMARLIAAKASA
jgi:3-dehydroquinate dehydratase II